MPTVALTTQQVLELVEQLPDDAQDAVVRALVARRWPKWADWSADAEETLKAAATAHGRDWDAMSGDERDEFAAELAGQDPNCDL